MSRQMKCLQLERPGVLKLIQQPLPEPGNDEVLLRVSHCALCRTDAKMLQRGQRDLTLPRVLGHEICGTAPATGERFVVWPGDACRICGQCLAGSENLCRQMRILGFHRDGGLAEFVIVPRGSLLPVPPNLPGGIACLAEPLACALNAIRQANLCAEKKLLIYGAGSVGLLMALAATAMGIETWLAEKNPAKLRLSEEFRSRLQIGTDLGASGPEFDAVINAAPAAETVASGLARLRSGGCFVLFSGLTDACPPPIQALNEIHYRQLIMVGAYGCTSAQMRDAVELLAEHAPAARLLIERRISLAEVPDALLQMLNGDKLKFVVEFQAEE